VFEVCGFSAGREGSSQEPLGQNSAAVSYPALDQHTMVSLMRNKQPSSTHRIRLWLLSALFLLVLFFPPRLQAAVGDWKTYTSVRNVRQVVCRDSLLWGATSGGVIQYNVLRGTLVAFTNSEGLAGNDIVAIALDQRGRVWAALSNGKLNLYSPASKTWTLINDYSGYQIQDLYPHGDSILVCLSIGISLFNTRRWEVKETYKIGDVRRVAVDGREIWAACKDGVRRASFDFPNLMAPNAWTRYTTADGLMQNEAFAVQAFNGRIFVAGKPGLSVFDGVQWLPAELPDFSVFDLTLWRDKLLAVTGAGIWVRDASGFWSRLANWLDSAQRAAVDQNQAIWLALPEIGLGYYQQGASQWTITTPDGPADNKFSALAFDHNGHLWTASPSAGISRFDGKRWRTFSLANKKLPANDFRDLAVDNRNRVWAASWGAGVAVFETDDRDSITVSMINSSDKRLSGISGDANYVVVTGIEKDPQGNLWLLNSHAADRRVVAVTDSLGHWQYFSTFDGLRSLYPTALAIDANGRKWIGSFDAGISVVDDNNTPFSKADDDLSQGLSSQDNLISLSIAGLAADRDGLIWIATPLGLQYWYNGQLKNPHFNVINENVHCVAVDVRNNKWIGTAGGLTVLESDGYANQHYSTSNSALVSDFITCFAFDEKLGYAFIGTTNGLSRLETPYTKPAEDLSQLTGYPNPFVLTGPGSHFYVENLAEKSSLRIYTPEGYLVRHIPQAKILGSRVSWDGRNDRGEYVASGVYVYLVSTENGLSQAGKVAVIRP